MGRVQGKVALITGGASGLGAETARRLAREGASVVISDLSSNAGEALADDISKESQPAIFLHHDVTDEDRWSEVVQTVLDRFGKIDVLVNSAGVADSAPLSTITYDLWRRTMTINVDGTFLGIRAVAPAMTAAGKGSIINISSIAGKIGMTGSSAYCASKGAVLMLTKACAVELAPAGVRVNSVHPGFTQTPMLEELTRLVGSEKRMEDLIVGSHPLGRRGEAREIADGIVFLASDESSFMTGSELVIDGGYTAQ